MQWQFTQFMIIFRPTAAATALNEEGDNSSVKSAKFRSIRGGDADSVKSKELTIICNHSRPGSSSSSSVMANSSHRPTTANSVIEMLHIEKVQDGSGLTLCGGGVFVASQCHVILFVMSGIFTVVGALLSAISYRPKGFGEDIEKFLARQVNHQSQSLASINWSMVILITHWYRSARK